MKRVGKLAGLGIASLLVGCADKGTSDSSATESAGDDTADSAPLVNRAPIAVDDTFEVTEDALRILYVLSNDTDPDDDPLSIDTLDSGALLGRVVVNPDDTLLYDPTGRFDFLRPGESAVDTFDYAARDLLSTSNTAQGTVTVTGVDDPPVSRPDAYAVAEGATLTVAAGEGLLANDTDAEGDAITAVLVSGPAVGALGLTPDGAFTYTHDGGEVAVVAFTYRAVAAGAQSAVTRVDVTVGGANDAPVLDLDGPADEPGGNLDTAARWVEGAGPHVITAPTLTVSDVDDTELDGATAVLTNPLDGAAEHLEVDVSGTGLAARWDATTATLSITGRQPLSRYAQVLKTLAYDDVAALPDTTTRLVTVTVNDGELDSAPARAAVDMNGVDDPPVGVDDLLTTTEDAPVSGNLVANDTDADYDDLAISRVWPGAVGTVTTQLPGAITWSPAGRFEALADGQIATDTFDYDVSDASSSDRATVTVLVTGVNDPPVATDDAATTSEDAAIELAPIPNDTDVDGPLLRLGAVDDSAILGALTVLPNSRLRYDPRGAFDGLVGGGTATEAFTYVVEDGAGGAATGTVTVTVTGANDAPTPADDTATADENGPAVLIDVLANDTDPDVGDALTLLAVGAASGGSTTAVASGRARFTPVGHEALHLGDTAVETFAYTARDAAGATATATVTFTVHGTNDAPMGVADTATAGEDDGAVDLDVLANDTDVDAGAVLSILSTATGSHGSATTAQGGRMRVALAGWDGLAVGQTGTETFSYRAVDDNGAETGDVAVTLTVQGRNDAPTAGLATATTAETTPITAPLVADDVDADDDRTTLSYTLISGPSAGTLSLGAGTFTFDPAGAFADLASGATRQASFRYLATDRHGATAEGSGTVTVTGTNQVPTAAAVTVIAVEDGPTVTGRFLGSDVDLDALTYQLASAAPSPGTFAIGASPTFTYAPGTGFQSLSVGATTVLASTYTARDPSGATSAPASLQITVQGRNDAPTATALALSATEDGAPVSGQLAAADVDAEETVDTLTYALVSTPPASSGAVSRSGVRGVTYTPGTAFQDLAVGQTRVVSATWVATDRHGASSPPTALTVTVTGTNDAPVALPVAVTAYEDGTVTAPFTASDVDSDGAGPTCAVVAPPGKGAVTNHGNCTFTFAAAGAFTDLPPGATEVVTFTWRATDNHGAHSAPATVTVTVVGVNSAPVASAISGSATEDGSQVVIAYAADDPDADDSPATLAYGLPTLPPVGQGAAAADPAGVRYAPGADLQWLALGQTTAVGFTYRATDRWGAFATAPVTVTVTGTNDAPTAGAAWLAATEDGAAVTGTYAADDVDSDDSPATLLTVKRGDPAEGSVVDLTPGAYRFTPGAAFQDLAKGELRAVTFPYRATDAHGAHSADGLVTVTVTGANDAPTAAAVTASVSEGAAVTAGFSADDVDSDDTPTTLSYAVETPPATGSAAVVLPDRFRFDAAAGFDALALGQTTPVTFTWRASDRHGATGPSTLATVTVTGTNDAPVATPVAVTTAEDAAVLVALTGDDVDSDDTPATLTYAVLAQPGAGTVTDHGDGTATFAPGTAFATLGAGQSQVVTFTYRARDRHLATSAPATVTVTVTGRNQAPVANPDVATTHEGATVQILPLANDTDADLDTLTVTALGTSGLVGVATRVGNVVTYDPHGAFEALGVGQTAQDAFTYTVDDGHGGVRVGTVTVTVTGVNDAPVLAGWSTVPLVRDQAANGTIVGTVSSTDVDTGPPTYALVGGDTTGAFGIDATTGVIRVTNGAKTSCATVPSYQLRVQVDDGHGGTAERDYPVDVGCVYQVALGPALDGGGDVAQADAACGEGWRALIGTTTGRFVGGSDWVLRPRAFYDGPEGPIAVTDTSGWFVFPLISAPFSGGGAVPTGLDKLGLPAGNCDDWASPASPDDQTYGDPARVDSGAIEAGVSPCSERLPRYCVQAP